MDTASDTARALSNRILSIIPSDEYARMFPQLEYVELQHGQVLHSAGEPITHVYFPYSGTISILAPMRDGSQVEIGIVGKEGMFGLPILLGTDTAPFRAVVQVVGGGMRMKASAFREEAGRCGGLRRLLLRYAQAFFVHTAQTAACNRIHTVETRLARWLLVTRDRAQSNSLKLTQEFLSIMLGIRRAGVSVALGELAKRGLIEQRRGEIMIVDSEGLERSACECYEVVRQEYERLVV